MYYSLLLTLALITSVKSLIFAFLPNGDSIKGVVDPVMNSLNTTDANGNPTYTSNLVRVMDPVLAVQLQPEDLVTSPDYHIPRNELQYSSPYDSYEDDEFYPLGDRFALSDRYSMDDGYQHHAPPSSIFPFVRDPIPKFTIGVPRLIDTPRPLRMDTVKPPPLRNINRPFDFAPLRAPLEYRYPLSSNNINYGIVEPNFGNYPIYSFDNENPVQNFNHQSNPTFNAIHDPGFPSRKTPPMIISGRKFPPPVISPFHSRNRHPESLFTPANLFRSEAYTPEEIRYIKNIIQDPTKNIEAPTRQDFTFKPRPTDNSIRTDWPQEPKKSNLDKPERMDVKPHTFQSAPLKQDANLSSGESPDQNDPLLGTIMSTRTVNLMPLQIPEGFLQKLLANGIFSSMMDLPSGDADGGMVSSPRMYSLINPKKHNLKLYNPMLRGYHGGINPFAQSHRGVGYRY